MAEKSFGIKELNIIGSSGTPQLQSVENLKIRVGVGSTVIIGDSDSDFTSPAQVDSNNTTVLNVGIVTANYFYGSLISPGIATFYGDANTYLTIQNNNTNSIINHNSNSSSGLYLQSSKRIELTNEDATKVGLRFNLSGNHEVELFHNHVKRLETTGAGVNISGMLTASGITTVTGNTLFTKQLSVSTGSTFTGAIDANGGVDISGGSGLNVVGHIEVDSVNVSGIITAAQFSSDTTTIGQDISTRNLSVSGLSTYIGVATYKSDVFIDGTLTAGFIDGGNY